MSEAVTDAGDNCLLDVQPHYIRNRKYNMHMDARGLQSQAALTG